MAKTKTLLLLLFPLFLASSLTAQQSYSKKKIDSLINLTKIYTEEDKVILYQQISKLYVGKDNDSVFIFASLALESAQKDKSDLSFYEAYNITGDAYAAKFDFTSALENYINAKEYCNKINNNNKQISIFLSIGNTYRNLKKFSDAIDTYKQAIEIANEIEDYQINGLLLYKISLSYFDITDLNKDL